ncbi:GumC family protein [Acaryochloris marina NIES-2412]|uniref:GumC family protein n=1 Tax=Acaryochloris marina TaxID=155978 RepID=UPI004057D2C7
MAQNSRNIGFNEYRLVLQRRWLPASVAFLSVFSIGVAIAFTRESIYVAEGQLQFTKFNPVSKLTTLKTDNSKTEISNLDPLDTESKPLKTEAAVIQSAPVLQQTLKRLGWTQNSATPMSLKDFRQNLVVADLQDTDILQLTYQAPEPEQAAAAINTLMSVYLEKNIRDSRNEVLRANQIISTQLPMSEVAVKKAETALREFKEKNQIVDLKNREVDAEAKISAIQGKISDAQAQLARIQAESGALRNKLGMTSQQGLVVASLSQSPSVQAVLTQLQQKESQLALQRTQLQSTHPSVISLEQDVKALKSQFRKQAQKILGTQLPKTESLISVLQQDLTSDLLKLEANKRGLRSQIDNQSTSLAIYKQQIKILPRLAEEQRKLNRKLGAVQSTYTLLLKNQQEILAEANQMASNAKILAPALVPQLPVSQRGITYFAAGLLGIFAFLATIYILERSDQTIRTVEELIQYYEYPLLGNIPTFDNFRNPLFSKKHFFSNNDLQQLVPKIFLRDSPNSPISKAYQMLQVSLKSYENHDFRTLTITSTLEKEGKSTVVANLAMALAQADNQVLVIDANLHNPFQDHLWDQSNQVGLSNILLDRADIASSIQFVATNIDLITAGNLHASASGVFVSKKMALMLSVLKLNYDHILIDAPSLNLAADVCSLGSLSDGILMVVRPGIANVQDITNAQELLVRSKQTVIGLVINSEFSNNNILRSKTSENYFSETPSPYLWDRTSISIEDEQAYSTFSGFESEPRLSIHNEIKTPENLPLSLLKDQVEYLRNIWLTSADIVKEKEEELVQLRQSIVKLLENLKTIREYSYEDLYSVTELKKFELKLSYAQERQEFLESFLLRVRQRLKIQKAIFHQSQEVLEHRTKVITSQLDKSQN